MTAKPPYRNHKTGCRRVAGSGAYSSGTVGLVGSSLDMAETEAIANDVLWPDVDSERV